MVRIIIRMLRIPFKWLEFAFKCFESRSKGSNLHWNASNPFRMVKICIWVFQVLFEWFQFVFEWLEFGFKCDEFLSNGYRICFPMCRIGFEWFKFALECFESFSNGENSHSNASNLIRRVWIYLHWNASNPFRMVRIGMLRVLFNWFQFAFEWLESLFKG